MFRKRRYLCPNCRKLVRYWIRKRRVQVNINPSLTGIIYVKRYGVCKECGTEMLIPGLDDENVTRLEKVVKRSRVV